MERIRSYVTGMLVSFITWEAWQNIIVTLIVALLGGFAAAAGRQLHQRLYEWNHNKKKIREEEENTTDEEPLA